MTRLLQLVSGWCLFATIAIAGTQSSETAAWVGKQVGSELPEQALLAIGLVALDPGIDDASTSKEAMALRRAEALYMPFLLRTVLENSRQWGAVRLLPSADPATELLITGAIVASSGDRLVVRFTAIDSSGRGWLDQEYQATAQLVDYESLSAVDPFLPLYQQVAADLAEFRTTLTLSDLGKIIETSRLAYAAALAPEAFGEHLKSSKDGRLLINRLPAANDPMLARVERTRETEYLFIDAVDLQFGTYFRDLAPTYTAWRKLTLEARGLMEAYRNYAGSKRSKKSRKSASRSYTQLQELKLYQQTLREAIASFEFEIGPTTLDLDGDLVELSGSLGEQQAQWKSLLSRIYAEQTGLPQGRSEPP